MADSVPAATSATSGMLLCGPLLRYTYIDHSSSTWNGSILVVLRDSKSNADAESEPPSLELRAGVDGEISVPIPSATCLLAEKGRTFWRFSISVPLGEEDVKVVYRLKLPGEEEAQTSTKREDAEKSTKEDEHAEHKEDVDEHAEHKVAVDEHAEHKEAADEKDAVHKDKVNASSSAAEPISHPSSSPPREYTFWIPARDETMRMLFHSCNGFSLGVKEGTFAGPVLWKDVLRIHAEHPLHVMIGGGDQVYSDGVRSEGPLKGWANQESPRHRTKMKLTDKLKADLDDWYFKNYCSWYSAAPFSEAAASIPSLQIFDDHDIIDGFGSYQDKWMQAPIFLGIGSVAWKYYMLFQQHTPPQGEASEDPSWVIGTQKGPYIQEYSRSICTSLGKRVIFYGLDGRVDRTLERVCYDSTYDAMFSRLEQDVIRGQTTHLILLLGVPIAYPRLVWLENLLSAHTVSFIRWLNKIFGVAGSLFNKFDGSAELLDDLNDHWCAGPHKKERNAFVRRLQLFARDKQVRVTILSGDVHLAAVGRFFSKASMEIPQNRDPRYMVNIISSAITNAPPPNAVANMLNKRNKLHHLDHDTDENLMALFYQNPDGKSNTVNRTTLPSRNYCIITEHAGLVASKKATEGTIEGTGEAAGEAVKENGDVAENGDQNGDAKESGDTPENGNAKEDGDAKLGTQEDSGDMIVAHEQTGGIDHPSAAAPHNGTMRKYALDISLHAEIDPKSAEGKTLAYGFSIPFLET